MIDKVRRRMPWSKNSSPRIGNTSTQHESSDPSHSPNRPRFSSYGSEASSNTTPNRQRLPSSGDSSTMSIGSRKSQRVSSEEERLFKARRTVDSHLKKISNVTGQNYTLNRDTGMCYFPYQRFIVVIEVPADHPNSLYMYTCVCKLNQHNNDNEEQHQSHHHHQHQQHQQQTGGDNLMALMQVAMELNYMQHRTRGATLGMENSEVNLCLSTPLTGLTPAALKKLMDDFLQTTTQVNAQLERAKRIPHAPSSSSSTTMAVHSPARSSSVASSASPLTDSPGQLSYGSNNNNRGRSATVNDLADLPEDGEESRGSSSHNHQKAAASIPKPQMARRSSC
mmetsp:Transcript_20143/g.43439  ORF Transcript_20143/g.43439 Transcript_20143/m.43439 type:complete len:337 (+) Transcript_20143:371-1381(+)|eukprot:CAMPEP_0168736504 /NCGR_PEP_ID=MMETSP0724-20121128/9895_1 /TAXON_ID=265536 /ORGANISM="Amphiprora sp., Strain CCMP467" /LENGTH=336 /DNA_ID=CAMNT_0008783705 /DNA_START=334 /DNA_END=1344 /DNA_ORIENTATION=-